MLLAYFCQCKDIKKIHENLEIVFFSKRFYTFAAQFSLLSSAVEQLTRNEQVVGSIPMEGSDFI